MRLTITRLSTAVVFLLLTAPLFAEGQQPGKLPRIGVLSVQSVESSVAAAFREGLRERGYVEGQNIAIEWRSSRGMAERFPDLAAELVRLRADVIVATNNPAIAAAQRATRTIPIVMMGASDPIGTGFVASLTRPGGNITGLTGLATELQGKALQLLKEALPSASRVAVLWDPEPGRRAQVREAEVAAGRLGLQLQLLEVRSPTELDGVFMTIARERLDAVLVEPTSMTFAHRARIVELAAKNRLPTMGLVRWLPESGGLMAYGSSNTDLFRRTAYFVDRILKGTKPGELPVEQPTKFELVINLKTAKALDLTIPSSLLLRADQIID